MNTDNTDNNNHNEHPAQPIDPITAKKAEIEHYKGVLERYRAGRWLSQGRRHLETLEEELATLEAGAAPQKPSLLKSPNMK